MQFLRIAFSRILKIYHLTFSDVALQDPLLLGSDPIKPKRCRICPRKKDRKCRTFCQKCLSPICGEHSVKTLVCINCDLFFKYNDPPK